MKSFQKLIFLLFFCLGNLSAQSFLDRISLEEGLSQSQLHCILQDSQGFIWFGTQHGLNRYDGFEMKHFYHNPFDSTTLSQDNITFLFEDSRQQLWVGVEGGLNRYDPLQKRFVRYDAIFSAVGLPGSTVVTSMAEDCWNTLWISTLNGLWRFIPLGDSYLKIRYEADSTDTYAVSNSASRRVRADQNGHIWVASATGLNKIEVENPNQIPQQQKIHFLNYNNRKDDIFKNINLLPIYWIYCGRNGEIWFTSRNRLFRINSQHTTIQEFTPNLVDSSLNITDLLVDRFGEVWLGTANEGVFHYQLKNKRLTLKEHIKENPFAKNGLKSNFITSLYESKEIGEDIIWIGTREAGVQLYSRSKNSFRQWDQILSRDNNIAASSIFSLCTDSYGYVWGGTYEGIFRINQHDKSYKKYKLYPQHRPMSELQSIIEDHHKNLWVGSNEGLFKYDRQNDVFQQVTIPADPRGKQPAVTCLYEDSKANLWIGTLEYLLKKNGDSQQKLLLSKLIDQEAAPRRIAITAMQEDMNGQLWIGTNEGLMRYIQKSGEFLHYFNDPKNPKSLIDNAIMDLYCSPKGQVWVAGPRGLSKLIWEDGKATFKHYTEKEGLPNSFVYGILPDEQDRLWLSTNAGLSCFDPQTDQFRNYDSNDGFASREFNSGGFHRSADGELFFGGLGVLVSFHPGQMIENQHLPQVAITSFRTAEMEQPLQQILADAGAIRLRYKDNFLSFNLAALDFTNPHKNELAYRLKGLIDNWIYMEDRRNISFPHLAPGDYILEVKSANNQGRWNNDAILQVPIIITPPFWRTWWFYILAFLFTGALVISAYRYRVQMKVQRAVELERVKLEENERVRKLAAQDLHDEFGNTLTRISLLTELIKAKSLNGNGEARTLINKISHNANRMYQGTKDFIWSINPEHDNFYEVAIRLKDFADDAFDTTGINFEVKGIDNNLKTMILPMGISRHIVMFFKEAMTNTLKHAQADKACLRFALENDRIKIEWKDNGVGFDANNNHAGNGIQNMRSRAKRIDAAITIDSDAGNGTSVKLELNTVLAKMMNRTS
ncbi:MAG: hypothetical protein IPJ74_10815 [Saprospiraceae bacterium]|nr:hypothetical protein [Saprospiraceae bacterium]